MLADLADHAAVRAESRLVGRGEIIVCELLRPVAERAPGWAERARAWLADIRLADEVMSIERAARVITMERHIQRERLYGLRVDMEEVVAYQRLFVEVLDELAGPLPGAQQLVMAARANLIEVEQEAGLIPSMGVGAIREEEHEGGPGGPSKDRISPSGSVHLNDPESFLPQKGGGSASAEPPTQPDLTPAAMLGGGPEAGETLSPDAPSGGETRHTPRRSAEASDA